MYFILFLIFLILSRLNSSLLGFEVLNPDESQMAANAQGLIYRDYDISYFDGNSSGFLNSIILVWPNFFNLDVTYLTTRLTSILLLTLIIFYTYKIIRIYLNNFFSLILVIPILIFFSFTKDRDFLHYSSEQLSSFLLLFSYWLFVDRKNKEKYYYLVPIILSLIFFSKIQFFPVALLFFVIILTDLFLNYNFSFKILLSFLSFFLLPSIFITILYKNNSLSDFYISNFIYPKDYIFNMNMSLANENSQNILFGNYQSYKNLFFKHLLYNSVFHLLYLYFIFFIFLIIEFIRQSKFKKKFIDKYIVYLILIIFSLILCILVPGRNFRHYLIPLIPFVVIFISKFLINFDYKNTLKYSNIYKVFYFFSLFFILSIFFEDDKFYSKKFDYTKFSKTNINYKNPEIFRYLNDEKSSIYIWGWAPQWYLLSGYNPAPRSLNSEKLIENNSYKKYYRERLINDLKKNNPNLIIDYVRKKSFRYNQNEDKITNFKELGSFLREKYTLLNSYNKDCPGFYLINEDFVDFKKNNVNYFFKDNIESFFKINDFSVTEDVCDDALDFKYIKNDFVQIFFDETEILKKVLILSSRKNTKEHYVDLHFFNNNEFLGTHNIKLKKFPYWTIEKLKIKKKANNVKINIKNLKLTDENSGINEVKFFR